MSAIELVLSELKNLKENEAAKRAELETKFMEAIGNRQKDLPDVDKLWNDSQTAMEKKFAELNANLSEIKGHYSKKEEPKSEYKSFGDFLVKVRQNDPQVKMETKAALAEGAADTGGYLVPEQYSNEILKLSLENTVVRGLGARIIPMTSTIIKIPALNMISNAAGSIYGGVTAYWGAEAGTYTESEPTFKQITLEPKKLTGYTISSDELIDDSIVNMGGLLSQMFAETLAFEEDVAFISGNGINKPLGILNAPCAIASSRVSATLVQTADLITMISRFLQRGGNPVFIVNQSVLPQLYKLKDENSNYILLPGSNGNIAGSLPATIYGIPVVVTEKASTLGTAGDVILADMRYYLIGDRQGLMIKESEHVKFTTDQKVWKFSKRVDGQPWLSADITPRNGGVTLSPFVYLS